jgi:sugar phosphate isomerase/epimerase
MSETRPLVGAAMMSNMIPEFRDWLLEDGGRDLEIQDAIIPAVLDGDHAALARLIRESLPGYNGRLGVHGPFLGLPLAAFDPEIQQVVQKRLLQSLDFCAAVGATHMVVHSPYQLLGDPVITTASDLGIGDSKALAFDTLLPVVKRAAEVGCTLVIECIFDRHPLVLVDFVRAFESPFVKLSVDVGHAFINHTWQGAPPPDVWIREAGALLGHVHLQDTDGWSDRHWPPGEGKIGWDAIFQAISTTQANPRLILELKNLMTIPQGHRLLVEWGLAR